MIMDFIRNLSSGLGDASGGSGSDVIVDGAIFVDPVNGTDVRGELNAHSMSSPFSTLAAAVSAATAGDTIILSPGTHSVTGALTISDLTIQGSGRDRSIISCDVSAEVLTLRDGTVLRDLRLLGGSSTGQRNVIYMDGAGDVARMERIDYVGRSNSWRIALVQDGDKLYIHDLRYISGPCRKIFEILDANSLIYVDGLYIESGSAANECFRAFAGGAFEFRNVLINSDFTTPAEVFDLEGNVSMVGRGIEILSTPTVGLSLPSNAFSPAVDIDGLRERVRHRRLRGGPAHGLRELSYHQCSGDQCHCAIRLLEQDHGRMRKKMTVSYNKSRLAPKQVQLFQCLLGLEPTGRVDDEFVESVRRFQDDMTLLKAPLLVDGKLGPKTEEMILSEILDALPFDQIRLGVWFDQSPAWSVRNASKIAGHYRDMGIDFVQIMANPSGQKEFSPRWIADRIRDFTLELAKHDPCAGEEPLCAGLTLWAYSSKDWSDTLRVRLPALVQAVEAPWEVLELDNEGYVSPSRLQKGLEGEFATVQEWTDEVDAILTENSVSVCGSPIQLGTTPHRYAVSGATNVPRIDLSAEVGGRLTMQAYSEAVERSGARTDPLSTEGPGREQWVCLERAAELMDWRPDHPEEHSEITEIAVGIPAFDQARWADGRSAKEALFLAVVASIVKIRMIALGRGSFDPMAFRAILCIWSAKFLVGAKRNQEVVEFFELLKRVRDGEMSASELYRGIRNG